MSKTLPSKSIFILMAFCILLPPPLLSEEALSKEQVLAKFGSPSYTRKFEGEEWCYYLGQRDTPNFILKLKEGKTFEHRWVFTKIACVMSGQAIIVAAPEPEDLLKIGASYSDWLDEFEWFAPWSKITAKDRAFLLDFILVAAKKFGHDKAPLPMNHSVMKIMVGKTSEKLALDEMKDKDGKVDVIAVIKRYREQLLQ